MSGKNGDSSGAVLPGVTVRAVHETTGNAFQAVTDGLGTYRMSVRVGRVRVTAELQGFGVAQADVLTASITDHGSMEQTDTDLHASVTSRRGSYWQLSFRSSMQPVRQASDRRPAPPSM